MAIRLTWEKPDMLPVDTIAELKPRNLFSPRAGTVRVFPGFPRRILAVPPAKSRDLGSWYRKILASALENSSFAIAFPPLIDAAEFAAVAEILRELPETENLDIFLDVSGIVPDGAWEMLSQLKTYLSDALGADDINAIPKFPDIPDLDDIDNDLLPISGRLHTDADVEPPEPPNLLDEAGKPLHTMPAPNFMMPGMAPPCKTEPRKYTAPGSLEDWIKHEEAGFSETLLKMIDDAGKKDSQVYSRANISRQHFSKIRNNPDYKPTKQTAVAFAIALELDLEQTQALIGSAGYVLNRSSKFDLIILYFLNHKNYDLAQINIALLAFDQKLLGL